MKYRLIVLMLVLLIVFSGCSKKNKSTDEPQKDGSEASGEIGTDIDTDRVFSDRDRDGSYDESGSVTIKLSDSGIECASNKVTVSTFCVTVKDEGTYVISGGLSDGSIIVDADKTDKVQLVLSDASITSKTSAAIYVRQADKVFVTLKGENSLTNGGSFVAIDDNNIDAVIFSKDDLTVNGSGCLALASPAGHGIASKDELTVVGATLRISAASHALSGKDSVCISGASINAESGKDAIHAENADDTALGYVYVENGSLELVSGGDGISASGELKIDGGEFHITAGGGHSSAGSYGSSDDVSIKGIKSTGNMDISGGSFEINAFDDAVHSNASASVLGGTFEIATGDDGFHADETLYISSGKINITASYEGLEALNVSISGGEISLIASDDGINAAGGTDESGFGGPMDNDGFGGGFGGRPGGHGGGMPGGAMPGGTSSSNGTVKISGGTLYIEMGGDGIDANGSLEISGGYTVVCGGTSGDTAVLDYDTTATITGGTFIGTGAMNMAQTFSEATGGVLAVRMNTQSAGTAISVKNSSGAEILSYTPDKSFQLLIVSTPEIKKGSTYSLVIGELTGDVEAS